MAQASRPHDDRAGGRPYSWSSGGQRAGICRLTHADDGIGYVVDDRDALIDLRLDAVDCSNTTIYQ
ncbi:MAG: hypothetical protein ACKODY_12400, partial [Actinomycetota bacterium]